MRGCFRPRVLPLWGATPCSRLACYFLCLWLASRSIQPICKSVAAASLVLGRVDEFEVLPTKSTTYGKIGVSINSSKINGLVLIRQHALVIGLWQLKLNATAQAKIIVAGLPEVLAQRLGMGR